MKMERSYSVEMTLMVKGEPENWLYFAERAAEHYNRHPLDENYICAIGNTLEEAVKNYEAAFHQPTRKPPK